jgi:hypothetical protein
MEAFRQPVLKNRDRAWVAAELDKLRDEWAIWQQVVAQIADHPYDSSTHSDVFADGEANMRHHSILQAKTLAFLNTNIENHGFIEGFDGTGCDRTDLRLSYRVKHRLHALDALRASLPYAEISSSIEPSPASKPRHSIRNRIATFWLQHWQKIVGWVFAILAAVLTTYLAKRFS